MDLAFGAGLLTFDEVCKKVEAMALRDEDDLKMAYTDAQVQKVVSLVLLPLISMCIAGQHENSTRTTTASL